MTALPAGSGKPEPESLGSPTLNSSLSQHSLPPNEPCSKECCEEVSSSQNASVPDYLKQFLPTSENASELREKILSTLLSLRPLPSLDLDSLAQDIFLEAWTRHLPVTTQFIRHRYFNRTRDSKLYRLHVERSAITPHLPLSSLDYLTSQQAERSTLETVISLASLSHEEFLLLYYIYFRSLRYEDAASQLRHTHSWVKETLVVVLEKLRRAGRAYEVQQARLDRKGDSL